MKIKVIYLIVIVFLTLNAVQAGLLTDGDHSKFVSDFLSIHNAFRKSVSNDLPYLKWDEKLAAFASKTASTCNMSHSSNDQRTNLAGFSYVGENLSSAASSTYTKTNMFRLPIAKKGLEQWFKEQADYSYVTNKCVLGKECGHYTQMIWKKSMSIGCAIAACSPMYGMNWGYVMACNYGPGGNYVGQRPY